MPGACPRILVLDLPRSRDAARRGRPVAEPDLVVIAVLDDVDEAEVHRVRIRNRVDEPHACRGNVFCLNELRGV